MMKQTGNEELTSAGKQVTDSTLLFVIQLSVGCTEASWTELIQTTGVRNSNSRQMTGVVFC